jgi:hypothetical protein
MCELVAFHSPPNSNDGGDNISFFSVVLTMLNAMSPGGVFPSFTHVNICLTSVSHKRTDNVAPFAFSAAVIGNERRVLGMAK